MRSKHTVVGTHFGALGLRIARFLLVIVNFIDCCIARSHRQTKTLRVVKIIIQT